MENWIQTPFLCYIRAENLTGAFGNVPVHLCSSVLLSTQTAGHLKALSSAKCCALDISSRSSKKKNVQWIFLVT